MNKRPTVRFLSRLALTGAIGLASVNVASAQQLGGGEFAAPINSGTRTQVASDQTKSTFNSLPFRIANGDAAELVTDSATGTHRQPIQLMSPVQKLGNVNLPNPVISNRAASQMGSGKIKRNQSQPRAVNSLSQPVKATPASFGKPAPSQLASQDSSPAPKSGGQIAKYVDLNNCTVSFIDDIMLPAKESGVIESLGVKEGEFIPAGKVVGKIDDELYQRMLEQADMRFNMAKEMATDTTSIQAAEKKYRVAGIEAAKTKRLNQSGSRSDSEVLMAVYSKDIALLELEKAQREKDKAFAEARLEAARLNEVQTRIKRHVLQSDFDAYVIEIMKKPQEFVQSGDEVMRIARMDKLWVQGVVNIADLNPNEVVDRPVTVTVDLARGETTTFEGKIVYVALERQSLKSYMVKAEIQNRPAGGHWVLQPLSSVQMRIHLDGDDQSFGTAAKPSVKR